MYTLIKRTVPPPSMIIFDASNRDICEVKRLKTNTPLQALVMMNDPAVLEASRVLAAKLIAEKKTPEETINKAFRTIVCRKPTAKELKILTDYHQNILMGMEEKQAVKLLSVGEYPLPVNINKKELASLMRIVNTIYNMEETITKS
jgi:S-adenosylmethionine:tRNA-ribosyltransferase-isomerase (queuine synthetase)